MIDALTVGQKAAKYGYKKYGVPGAIVAGALGVFGLFAAKRIWKQLVQSVVETDSSSSSGSSSSSNSSSGSDTDTDSA